MSIKSISDIKHVYYINLTSRPDRKQCVEHEIEKIGLHASRFNAVKMANGAIGCSMSHYKLLKMAETQELDHILILEDDIQFTNPLLFVTQFNMFLQNHNEWDVVLIAGNNMGHFDKIDDTCVRVFHCQTTTGYLIRKPYYHHLIKNIEIGLHHYIREPHNKDIYAIDQYWSNLQMAHTWYLIIPLSVTQREDYSDIEKRHTNYTSIMLDLDKIAFFKRRHELETLRKLNLSHT